MTEKQPIEHQLPHPYQVQYQKQLHYLENITNGCDPHSPYVAAVTIARETLLHLGPGNNGILSTFLRELAERALYLETTVCSIPIDKEEKK